MFQMFHEISCSKKLRVMDLQTLGNGGMALISNYILHQQHMEAVIKKEF